PDNPLDLAAVHETHPVRLNELYEPVITRTCVAVRQQTLTRAPVHRPQLLGEPLFEFRAPARGESFQLALSEEDSEDLRLAAGDIAVDETPVSRTPLADDSFQWLEWAISSFNVLTIRRENQGFKPAISENLWNVLRPEVG